MSNRSKNPDCIALQLNVKYVRHPLAPPATQSIHAGCAFSSVSFFGLGGGFWFTYVAAATAKVITTAIRITSRTLRHNVT